MWPHLEIAAPPNAWRSRRVPSRRVPSAHPAHDDLVSDLQHIHDDLSSHLEHLEALRSPRLILAQEMAQEMDQVRFALSDKPWVRILRAWSWWAGLTQGQGRIILKLDALGERIHKTQLKLAVSSWARLIQMFVLARLARSFCLRRLMAWCVMVDWCAMRAELKQSIRTAR
eukprot:2180744-Prymnesium_polylepis.1